MFLWEKYNEIIEHRRSGCNGRHYDAPKDKYSIAVRRPDNEIELKVEDYKCVFGNAKFLKYPLIRGVVSFVDSLVVGKNV